MSQTPVVEHAPLYLESLKPGDRVVAVYPNHRWGAGELVEVLTSPGLKPYAVRSDRSGDLGYFMADGVVREVPAGEYAARKAWRNPVAGQEPDGGIVTALDSVASFLSDDGDREAEYEAVVEARRRIATGL